MNLLGRCVEREESSLPQPGGLMVMPFAKAENIIEELFWRKTPMFLSGYSEFEALDKYSRGAV